MTLRDFIADRPSIAYVGVIDDWEKSCHGDFSPEDAVKKLGDFEVRHAVYSGRDGWDVWLDVPGMHLGYLNSDRLTIPGGNKEYAFFGRKGGKGNVVVRNGDNDYTIYWDAHFHWTGIDEIHVDCSGGELRGNMSGVIRAIKKDVWKECWK